MMLLYYALEYTKNLIDNYLFVVFRTLPGHEDE